MPWYPENPYVVQKDDRVICLDSGLEVVVSKGNKIVGAFEQHVCQGIVGLFYPGYENMVGIRKLSEEEMKEAKLKLERKDYRKVTVNCYGKDDNENCPAS